MNGVQIVKCKCGSIRAACCEPDCYTDTEWQKDLRDFVKRGYTVEIVKTFQFEDCKCGKNPNQTELLSK